MIVAHWQKKQTDLLSKNHVFWDIYHFIHNMTLSKNILNQFFFVLCSIFYLLKMSLSKLVDRKKN